jgi:hypothetical protein
MPRAIRDSIYELVVGGGNAVHISDSEDKFRYNLSSRCVMWQAGLATQVIPPKTNTRGSLIHRICNKTGPSEATHTYRCRTLTHNAGTKVGLERSYTNT